MGRATAERLAEAGVELYISARREERLINAAKGNDIHDFRVWRRAFFRTVCQMKIQKGNDKQQYRRAEQFQMKSPSQIKTAIYQVGEKNTRYP